MSVSVFEIGEFGVEQPGVFSPGSILMQTAERLKEQAAKQAAATFQQKLTALAQSAVKVPSTSKVPVQFTSGKKGWWAGLSTVNKALVIGGGVVGAGLLIYLLKSPKRG